LFAYDYLWDKKSVITDHDFKATYRLKVPGKEEIQMNMWMKGFNLTLGRTWRY